MNKRNFRLSVLIKTSSRLYFACILFFLTLSVSAQQYNATGTAFAMSTPGCYTLTNTTSQAGAIWNIYTIDLTQPFDITLTLNFGNRPGTIGYVPATCGADGMSFVLQPVSTGVFGEGSGVGFHGINPSLGVIMDSYTANPTDPAYQHISINQNGDETHTTYTPSGICPPTGTVLVYNPNELTSYCDAVNFPSNITDGLDHLFRFTWTPNASGGTANAYFGTSTALPTTPTITYTGDIVNNIFSGNPNVYWGVSASTGGCWNLQTVCITTVANFIADTIVCYGIPVSFFDNSISGLPISSWSWNFGDGGTSNQQNPTHIFSAPGTYLVTLTIYNSGGFSSVMTHTIVVNPKPIILVNNDSICLGDTATLTASGAISYYWNYNNITDSVIKVSPPVTTFYIVTGQNQYYCTNTDTAWVTVYPLPVITATSDSICKGDTATLTASGGDTYIWYPSGSTANPFKVSPTTPTQYTVVGTSNTHGCQNSATDTVSFYPAPSISLSADVTSGCEPLKVTFTNLTDPATSTYIWNFGDNSPTDTSTNPVHTYTSTNSPFSVTLTATSANGCSASFTVNNYINVYPQPHAQFTWSPPTGVLSNPTINFNSSTTPSNPLFNNIWNFGDSSALDYSQNPSHLFTSASTFNVILIVTTDSLHGNCSDTVIHSILIVDDSLIFPNIITPNNDGFNDNFKIGGLEKGGYPENKLVVYNRWGKKVYESNNYVNGSFDGEGLPDGVYYYIFTAKSVLHEIKHQSSLEILR